MQQDVDVAGWPCRGVLGAADKVEGLHPKSLRIEICRDPLGHAKTPAPVFIRSPVNGLSLAFDGCDLMPWGRQESNRLVQVGVHEHSQDESTRFQRYVSYPERLRQVREFGEQLLKDISRPQIDQ